MTLATTNLDKIDIFLIHSINRMFNFIYGIKNYHLNQLRHVLLFKNHPLTYFEYIPFFENSEIIIRYVTIIFYDETD